MKDLDKKLYIWSSNHSSTLKKYLSELGILNKFELIVSREMVDFIKPDSSGFNKYFSNLSEDKDLFLMVGDSIFDKEAASNSGINYLDITEI